MNIDINILKENFFERRDWIFMIENEDKLPRKI